MFYLFPQHLTKKGSKIILYGAGPVMRCYVNQLKITRHCEVLFSVDRNYEKIEGYRNVEVVSPQEILKADYDKIVVAVSSNYTKSVYEDILDIGVPEDKIVCEWNEVVVPTETAESVIVRGIFAALGIKRPSYIDCGAYHPHLRSNTAFLYYNGSRGINVEANPRLMDAFYTERPDDININIGIAPEKGEGLFYMLGSDEINTFSKEIVEYRIKNNEVSCVNESITIQLATLNEIANKYNNGKFPDFLDVDIEGFDLDVLSSCDFTISSPKVICVEEGGVTLDRLNKIMMEKQCEGGGYLPYCRITENANMIYVRKDIYPNIFGL